MSQIVIRAAEAKDEVQWRALWAGYIKFYRGEVAPEATAGTWRLILDPESGVGGLVAEQAGRIVGFCNFLFHRSTWSTKPSCYLEDLYVDPAARGGGAARALIDACAEKARAKGASKLYWLTQEYNAPARSLYDTITPRSSFIVYEKGL